jgi:hypothetical protein
VLPRSSLTLLALIACRPVPELIAGGGDLRVAPPQLDFGDVASGSTATRTLTLQNVRASPIAVHVASHAPFEAVQDVQVEGGAELSVEVRFAPPEAGASTGVLDLSSDAGHVFVPVDGRGVDCPAIDACHTLQISNGVCEAAPRPDGTPCEAACVVGAACSAGVCVGASDACDDGDACTIDVCDPSGGCSHTPLHCPSSPCMAATCDARAGCGLTPVTDGTSCGDAVCAWADICMGGACQRKATPNADLECRYIDVVASEDLLCALTRGGHVRCWGGTFWFFDAPAPLGPLAPTTLSGWSNIVALSADENLCGVDTSGAVKCGRAAFAPTGGVAPAQASLAIGRYGGWVLSPTGEASVWQPGSPLTPYDGGLVEQVEVDFDTWLLDGQNQLQCLDLWCSGPVANARPGARLSSFGAISRLALIDTDGTLELSRNRLYECNSGPCPTLWGVPFDVSSSEYLWDAGAIEVGGLLGNSDTDAVCAARKGGEILCRDEAGLERRYHVPGEVVKLTRHGRYAICALNDFGDVWCWGDNSVGQLGDPSLDLEPRFLDGTVSSLWVGLTVSDGGLYGWGVDDPPWPPYLEHLDGGIQWSSVSLLAPVGGAQLEGDTPLLLDHGELSRWDGSALQHLASGVARCGGVGRRICVTTGPWAEQTMQFGCVDVAGKVAFYGPTCASTIHQCDLTAGIVTCDGTPIALPALATVLSTGWSSPAGCAILPGGEVRCWDGSGGAAQPIPGLMFGARQVQGALGGGCAVIGQSTVQCWGDNTFGVLGDPAQASGVKTRVFDEPVVQLTSFDGDSDGLASACVRLQSGRAACWGWNEGGLFGRVMLSSDVPIQIMR